MTRRERGTGRIYRQKGCSKWTIQYSRNGRRIREATGTDNYQVARQKLRQRMSQISTGVFAGPQVERITVTDLFQPYVDDLQRRGKGTEHPQRRWTLHLEPHFGWMRVINVGTDALNKYVNERKEQGAKPATINREMAALRAMFRLGYYSDPPKLTRLPKFPHCDESDNVRKGFLEPQQYAKMTNEASELWLRTLVEIYHTYGWRKREVLRMRVEQADFVGDVIRLDVGATKNKEGREVHMTPTVRSLLLECARGKKPKQFLFTRENGKPVRDFRDAWHKLCIAAGVAHMECRLCGNVVTDNQCGECGSQLLRYVGLIVHDMRRTAARNLRRAGVAEGVIMRTGGWKTRSVFERYNIVDQRDIREALERLEEHRKIEFGHKVGHNQPEIAPQSFSEKGGAVN